MAIETGVVLIYPSCALIRLLKTLVQETVRRFLKSTLTSQNFDKALKKTTNHNQHKIEGQNGNKLENLNCSMNSIVVDTNPSGLAKLVDI